MTYLEVLDSAWRDHLAPREEDAPTVISLFAGCGGSSLGYSMAGYRELLAVEWDANAVETFRLNFPGVPVYHGDIATLSVEKCLSLAGIAPGELDVLDGSPPCQGFSTAGKREMRVDVLGVTDYTFALTAHAKAHGWDVAFGPGVVSSSISQSGRGERARASGTRQIRGCRVTVGGHQGPVDLVLTA